ncbi:high-affinity iron transporter [Rhodoblastus acidophilus]|uniref:FTR1 family iron permease n=1 Tax=Rhodoblastus acidophilus TaxID=1074 RepID=UPI0022254E9F|nr:FTR1 family protein [Rhodoblastus acidophilus]MCW2283897.1 high-affinity iron transporter [Rhodoblastus acidophilus]MCW2332593.1 high-affinity iron transporter [Rhodoblastus acidophilus]
MLGALIIVFREVIEAGLIVGIVLAVTRGVPRRGFFVAGGVAAGVLGACLLAIFAKEIAGALEGMGQELFNAGVLILASCMLAWHNIWMASHGREMAAELRGVGQEVAEGGKDLTALAIVVAVAVLREGSEVVLFLYGVAASGKETVGAMLAGGAAGVALGAALSALMFYGLVKIPAKTLFGVTTALITFLAAGMASQSVVYLQQAGLVEAWSRTLWNTSALLPDDSMIGRVLHVLFGYVDQPSGMQVAVYLVALIGIFLATRAAAPKPPAPSLKVAKS